MEQSSWIRHPNLWIFLRKVKDEEKNCRIILRSTERGDAPQKKTAKVQTAAETHKTRQKGLQNRQKQSQKYWGAVSYAIGTQFPVNLFSQISLQRYNVALYLNTSVLQY